MKRYSFEDMNCSIAQSLEQIGEWWTPLIIRDALLGVRRFEDFQSRLGISRNILSTRLDKLVDDGILERRLYSERPPRYEYVLTDKGRDLWRVMTVLREWGDRWITGEERAPLVMVHDGCGQETTVQLICSRCGDPLERTDVHMERGPGGTDGTLTTRPRERAGRD